MVEIFKDIKDIYIDRHTPQTSNTDYYKWDETPKGPYAKDPERFNKGILRFIPSVFKNMFNLTGRTSRLQYIKNILWLGVFFLTGVIIITACGFQPKSDQYHTITTFMAIVIGWGLFTSSCRRLAHAGYDWYTVFVILIPLFGPFFFLWMITRPQDFAPYQISKQITGRDIYDEYQK